MEQPYPKSFLNVLLDTATAAGISSPTFRTLETVYLERAPVSRTKMHSLVSRLTWEIELAGALFYGPTKVA
ncbi:MAG: hypothetical protein KIT08_01525 [Anaerolineales bacterium]|nr:MAG: hypothetical protein KIT08_01525 [Anaerolineales bacterium]